MGLLRTPCGAAAGTGGAADATALVAANKAHLGNWSRTAGCVPSATAEPASLEELREVLAFARARHLRVKVRGG